MYSIETLQWKDYSSWVEHCGSVFGGTGAAYFNRHVVNDPHRNMDSIFLIKQDGIIAATVRVFQRHIFIDGKKYKMGGIGEVSTKEQFRGKGMSYEILAHCVKYMKENDFDLSMLGTGYFGHYKKHGFLQVPMNFKRVEGGKIDGDAELRPLEFARDSSDAYKLYKKYSRLNNGAIARDFEYYICWSAAEMINPTGLFRNGALVGYVCFDYHNVTELICADEDVDILLGYLKPNEDGEICVYNNVKTSRTVKGTYSDDSHMVNLIKPFELGGKLIDNSDKLADYLSNSGGIVFYSSDGF